jgi:hypothetical protein
MMTSASGGLEEAEKEISMMESAACGSLEAIALKAKSF